MEQDQELEVQDQANRKVAKVKEIVKEKKIKWKKK